MIPNSYFFLLFLFFCLVFILVKLLYDGGVRKPISYIYPVNNRSGQSKEWLTSRLKGSVNEKKVHSITNQRQQFITYEVQVATVTPIPDRHG